MVEVAGLSDLTALLSTLPDKLKARAIRNALAAGARAVRDVARKEAPVIDSNARAVRLGWRKPKTVRDAIVVRTSKKAKQAGNIGVFINVRPAKGAKYKATKTSVLGVTFKGRKQVRASNRGAKSPNDPFYWRFLEFGTKHMAPRPFLVPAAAALNKALEIFQANLGKQVQRLNSRGDI